jgi:hypothetical protein
MRKIIEIAAEQIRPDRETILETQGIPPGGMLAGELELLLEKAMEVFVQCSRPVSLISTLSASEFQAVYRGEGLNEKKTPLDDISGAADGLALFAVTVGETVTGQIKELFDAKEFALGSMLDSAASAGTEKAADFVQSHFFNLQLEQGKISGDKSVMRFSPGYCGWHMSGQKKLFKFLHPEDIGIRLLDSFLMQPLKSISGVMVAGRREIFSFEDSYGFCSQCSSHTCRERIKNLMRTTGSDKEKGAT